MHSFSDEFILLTYPWFFPPTHQKKKTKCLLKKIFLLQWNLLMRNTRIPNTEFICFFSPHPVRANTFHLSLLSFILYKNCLTSAMLSQLFSQCVLGLRSNSFLLQAAGFHLHIYTPPPTYTPTQKIWKGLEIGAFYIMFARRRVFEVARIGTPLDDGKRLCHINCTLDISQSVRVSNVL